MTTTNVLLRDIAKAFDIDKSGARKYLRKKGFIFLRVRRKETGNQQELALSPKDYVRAVGVRENDGFLVKDVV